MSKHNARVRCRGCHRHLDRNLVNARGFCGADPCQARSNRVIAKAFRSAERIPVAETAPKPARDLPPPYDETPSLVSRLTPGQQRRLSALARSRMTTSEGLSPE